MSTLGLVASVGAGAAAAVIAVLVIRGRRRSVSRREGPRTVADLVQLRAGTMPSPSDGTAGVATSDGGAVEPEPVHRSAAAGPAGPIEGLHEDGSPVVEPADAAVADRLNAEPAPSWSGDDPPWGRAERMAGGGEPLRSVPPLVGSEPEPTAPTGRANAAAVADVPAEPAVAEQEVAEQEVGREPITVPEQRAEPAPEPAPEPEPAMAPTSAALPEALPAVEIPSSWVPEASVPEVSIPAARRSAESAAFPVSLTVAEAEQPDLALLRTFGFVSPCSEAEPTVSLAGVGEQAPPPTDEQAGPAQPIRFRASHRDGSGVAGARGALLDGQGREASVAIADPTGHGELHAPRPGGYVLVSTAAGHQPAAVAISVGDGPTQTEILLNPSASLSGLVRGRAGWIAGARLTLVQEGEVVDTAESDAGGTFRISDLAAGAYGLSVTAVGCEPAAVLLDIADGADVRTDVELDRTGMPDRAPVNGHVMIGHR